VQQKSIQAHKDISERPKSTKSHMESMQQNATNFRRTSHNGKKKSMKSHYEISLQNYAAKAYHVIRKSDMNMKKQNAQNPIRKSHYGKNRRRRQTSLTTDYYRPFSKEILQENCAAADNMKFQNTISYENGTAKGIIKSHNEISRESYAANSNKSHKDISQRSRKHEITHKKIS
jgi:hypothetical protein